MSLPRSILVFGGRRSRPVCHALARGTQLSGGAVKIESAFSFLVHPSKNEETQPEIGGTQLKLSGKLHEMLLKAFEQADAECGIDIRFVSDGSVQENVVRDELRALLAHCTIEKARALAERLQRVTTNRSGLGLFFVLVGTNGSKRRVYLTRFPADFGIVAREESDALTVEFIEEVFLRNGLTYKAVVFDGDGQYDFWQGKAVDRQVSQSVSISRYWIHEFLLSNFLTTAAAGTRRLALAISKTIATSDDVEVKEELAAASRLARSLNGQVIDMNNFADKFALSPKTREAINAMVGNPECRFDQFEFSAEEFAKHLRYRSILVDNGVMLTAPIESFDDTVKRARVAEAGEEYIFSTTGRITDEKLRKIQ